MNCYTSNSHEPDLADLAYQSCHGHAMPGGDTPDGKRRAMKFAVKIKALKAEEVSSFGPFFSQSKQLFGQRDRQLFWVEFQVSFVVFSDTMFFPRIVYNVLLWWAGFFQLKLGSKRFSISVFETQA